jgi:hypothetical protein
MRRLVALAAALAFSAGAAAQMYKWKDSNGHVRYGDTPPPGVDATPMRGPAGAPPPPPAEAKSGKDGKAEKPLTPEQAFQKRQKERAEAEEKAAKERAEADAKRSNCEQAQAQLRTLESGQRITTINAAGERVFVEDSERASMTARAQKSVSDWCN